MGTAVVERQGLKDPLLPASMRSCMTNLLPDGFAAQENCPAGSLSACIIAALFTLYVIVANGGSDSKTRRRSIEEVCGLQEVPCKLVQ